MRLTIQIDNIPHVIDTTDPELLGKWIIEIFGRMEYWTPATFVTVQAYPSWLWRDGVGTADWSADSRIVGSVKQLKSPRDLLKALTEYLDEAEAWKGEP